MTIPDEIASDLFSFNIGWIIFDPVQCALISLNPGIPKSHRILLPRPKFQKSKACMVIIVRGPKGLRNSQNSRHGA